MRFDRIYIEITDICGLNCSFCPTRPTNNVMSLELFENIISQASHLTKLIVCHVMGDPLVLSNIDEYIKIIEKYNLNAMITTSGFYIQNHQPSILLQPTIRQLNISLNSFNKNSTKISLDEYMNPILELCSKKISNNKDMFINLRLWNIDSDESESVFNNEAIGRLERFFNVTISRQNDKKGFRLAERVILHFDNYFEWPSLSNAIEGDGYCQGLSSHVAILNNGDVVPCCLDYEGVINLGNIRDIKLIDILNTTRSCSIINGFQDNIAIEELCQKCSYKNRFSKTK